MRLASTLILPLQRALGVLVPLQRALGVLGKIPLQLALVMLAILATSGCEDSLEWRCRQAVKQLRAAKPNAIAPLMQRVVKYGSFALVEIEQELQGAEPPARLVLLDAIGQIGDSEALPLLRFIARWDDEVVVQEKAKDLIKQLKWMSRARARRRALSNR